MTGKAERRVQDELIAKGTKRLELVSANVTAMETELNIHNTRRLELKESLTQLELQMVGGVHSILRHRKFENLYDVDGLMRKYVKSTDMSRIRTMLKEGHVDLTDEIAVAEAKERMRLGLKDVLDDYLEELVPEVVDELDDDGIDWVDKEMVFVSHGGRDKKMSPGNVLKNMVAQYELPKEDEEERIQSSIAKLTNLHVNTHMDSDDDNDDQEDNRASDKERGYGHAHALKDRSSLTLLRNQHLQYSAVSNNKVLTAEGDLGKKLRKSIVGEEVSAVVGSPVTGAALYALRDAYRVLKTDVIAQYLCASVGNVAEGLGLRLVGRSMQRSQMEQYIANGTTPLHVCAQLGHSNLLEPLVTECGLNIRECDEKGQTVLHYACTRGHMETVMTLVEKHQIDIDKADVNGFTALSIAVIGGFTAIARYLIEHAVIGTEAYSKRIKQVDVNQGACLLHWSMMSGRLPIVEYLIHDCGFSVEQKCRVDGSTPIYWAAYCGSLTVCKYLIEKCHVNIKKKGYLNQNLVHYAAASGSIEKVKEFIQRLGPESLSDKDDNNNKPADVAATDSLMEYIRSMKKASSTKGKLTGFLK